MRRLRVLVVEDSRTARALLVEVLTSDPGIEVVGEAADGAEAVRLAGVLRPDVITMDVEMPRMNGLEATREIMVHAPTPIVVVTATASQREAALSLDATEAGALWVASKPVSPLAPEFDEQARQLVATVKSMAQVKVVRRWARSASPHPAGTPPEPREAVPGCAAKVVAIAASTGGPAVLHAVLGRLPSAFPAPIIVVQHIARGFTGAFVSWLDAGCRLRVKLAADGEFLCPGTVYVAPEERQCGVSGGRVALTDGAPRSGFRPSASHLFEAVAREYGSAAAAVILTGMGADGVAGLRHVHAAGGRVIAQDEASCIVFGMPREAIAAGVVHAVLSPPAIANRLMHYVTGDSHA